MATRTSRRYQLSSAAAAFMIWGSWTFYVNDTALLGQRLISSFVQGTSSFIITLLMVRAVTWIYGRLPQNRLRLFLPAAITVAVTGSCLALIHQAIGTPRIASTIAPALTVAFLFCIYTTFKLRNDEGR